MDSYGDQIYGGQVQAAYKAVFPPGEVEVILGTCNSTLCWSPSDASMAAVQSLSLPVFDRALGRPTSGLCAPHMVCNVASSRKRLSPPPEAVEAIRTGQKLSRKLKAQIALLADACELVRLTLAYAVNRCLFPERSDRSFTGVLVLLLFQPPQGPPHANGLFARLISSDQLELCLYEPNGLKAALEYRTFERYLSDIETQLPLLLCRPCRVRAAVVGLGLQTLLGQTTRRKHGPVIVEHRRGYPICEAVVLYFFAEFSRHGLSQGLSPADFEVQLLETVGARDCRRNLLRFLQHLATWVQVHGAQALRRQFEALFAGSNVTEAHVVYGALRVAWFAPQRLGHRHKE